VPKNKLLRNREKLDAIIALRNPPIIVDMGVKAI